MACTAFQITEDDILAVLDDYALRVIDSRGQSFERLATELLPEIDGGRVENAALAAGCELDEQTCGAHDEIKSILVELGVLEF